MNTVITIALSFATGFYICMRYVRHIFNKE